MTIRKSFWGSADSAETPESIRYCASKHDMTEKEDMHYGSREVKRNREFLDKLEE